jgi:hypothetical protein
MVGRNTDARSGDEDWKGQMTSVNAFRGEGKVNNLSQSIWTEINYRKSGQKEGEMTNGKHEWWWEEKRR